MVDDPLTLDSTATIAGDTFLVCPDTPDPDAARWFASTINWLCNRKDIAFAKPLVRVETVTPLLNAWRRVAAMGSGDKLPRKKLTRDQKVAKFRELVPIFISYAQTDVSRIMRFLRYQLYNDTYANIFWAGGNTPEDLERAYDALGDGAATLMDQLCLESNADIAAETAERMYGHLSLDKVPVAYTYFGFVKGSIYASEAALYSPHWLREKAAISSGTVTATEDQNPECFLWGDLFEELYRNRRWHPDPDAFAVALLNLRKETLTFRPIKVLERYESMATAHRELTSWVDSQLHAQGFLPKEKKVVDREHRKTVQAAAGKVIAIALAYQVIAQLPKSAVTPEARDYTKLLFELAVSM